MTVLDSRRTLLQYVMDVVRETSGQANVTECFQAIKDAVKAIDSQGNWTFLHADRNISIHPPYSAGTISGSGGSAVVTGTGTSWDTGWFGRTLVFDGRLDYPVFGVGGPTALTLRDTLSGSDAFVDRPYTIYAYRYLLPDDCEPGRDVVLKGSSNYGRGGEIRKYPRALHERRKYETASVSGCPRWYTDGELDEATNRPSIILYPFPSAATELRLFYYHSFSIPNSVAHFITVPMAFERLIILKASSIIMGRKKMPNWLEKETEANKMMADLFNRHGASSAYDLQIEVGDYDEYMPGDAFQDSIYYPGFW